ncbi:helix-turn-helix domain-containing protein [Lichenibacterium minor]|nr:helix-turn-helix domain-containing protein [Lichenibacterium minor]
MNPSRRCAIRHDYLVNPADLGDAMALIMQRTEALAPAQRVKTTRAWVHEWCAFGSLLCRNADIGFTLHMFSDHPDFEDETFELDDLQAAEWVGKARHQVRAPTAAEVRLMTLTTADIAERWNCKRETIRYFIEGGHLPAFRVGQRHRIRRDALDRFERANSIRSMLAEAAGDVSRTTLILNAVATRLRANARSARAAAS